MIAATGKTTMLYCPKCRRTYEDGTQRFCESDGGRLLPAPSTQNSEIKSGGVFTNLLGKNPPSDEDKKTSAPRFIPFNKTEETDKKLTSFPSAGRIFQSEQFLKPKTDGETEDGEDSILELELPPKEKIEKRLLEFEPIPSAEEKTQTETTQEAAENKEETAKPAPRLVKPDEIASGTADVGDRRTNPLGREALSWDNLGALIGQAVKGRYQIVKELEPDDEESVIYLAEDKIFSDKRVVVRVFMNEDFGAEDFEEKIFAEEKVALSHLNHPNIAGVFDSGELPEGNTFIVSEYVEGEPLSEVLKKNAQFNALRTARIIRQTSYALSNAHQSGILHRNLKPENIILTVSDAGIEQVKLINFGVSRGEITDSNLAYKAPEEIERGTTNFASDIYALGVIAFQMIAGRFPFDFQSESELLKAQKRGLTLPPDGLRADIQPLADKILEKVLAFNPSERYPKARDFGDALFNALTNVAPWTKEDETARKQTKKAEQPREFFVVSPINKSEIAATEAALNADIHITPKKETAEVVEAQPAVETPEVKVAASPSWEKRSPEPPKKGSWLFGALAILGIIALLLGFWGISRWIANRAIQPENAQNQPLRADTPNVPVEKPSERIMPTIDADMAPQPRLQTTPPGAQRFQNTRENLGEALAKNFLGFEIFYPQDWTKATTDTNYLDVARREGGLPVEQIIITRYESRGAMTLDRPNFPKLVEKSNQDLKKFLGDSFNVVWQGESAIQNGRWKVYEVKFQGTGENENGEKITLWGRRLWLPVQRAGEQNGFVITLLATSLSDAVNGVDDVGVRGELANVLETFEPEQ